MKSILVIMVVLCLSACAMLQPGYGLMARYYSTYEGVTRQDYPDVDWPYVTYTIETEPLHIVPVYMWINYDMNVVYTKFVDKNTQEEDCAVFYFTNVKPCPTADWRSAHILGYTPLFCESVDSQLAVALGQENL